MCVAHDSRDDSLFHRSSSAFSAGCAGITIGFLVFCCPPRGPFRIP